MTRRALTFLVVIAVGLGAGCVTRPEGFEKRSYKVDPSLHFKKKDLDELVSRPPLGLEVEFVGLFNRMDEPYWQPSVTGFKPEDFRSFSVWDPDAAVWDPIGRGSSVGTIYASNEIFFLPELVKTAQYQPLKLHGIVRNTFADRPWIEVVDLEKVGEPAFSREAVSALYNGLQDSKANPTSAEQSLNRALKGKLTPAGQAAAYNGLAWMAHYKRDYAGAEKSYLDALAVHPENEDAKDGLWRARNKKEPKSLSGATGTSTATSNDDRLSLVREISQLTKERDDLKGKQETEKTEFSKAILAESEARKKSEADSARAAEQVKAMTAELDDARKRLQGSGGDSARIKELEAAIAKAADQQKAVETERDDLKKKLTDAGGAAAKVVELEASLKTASEKATAAETERDDLKKKLQAAGGDAAKVAELEASLKTASDKAKALETERDDLKKRIEGAGGDAAKLAEMDASLKAAAEKLKTAEAERDDLKKKLEAGGGDAAKLAEMDASLKAAGEKLKTLEAERDDLKKKLEAGGGDAAKLAEIEAKVKTLEAERDDLKKKLETAAAGGGDTEALKKQIAEKDAQIKTLTDSAAEFEQKIKDRDATIKSLREEIDKLTEELKKKG